MTTRSDAPPHLVVERAGIATSLRDGGRTGMAHLGRSRGGAVDRDALRLANRLVGNTADAPAFETSGGLVVVAARAVLAAVTGSQVDLEVSGGPPLGWGVATALPAGAVLRIGRLRGGARVYLAVRGGLRSDALADGVWLADVPVVGEPSPVAAVPRPLDRPVRLWPGPRLDTAGRGELPSEGLVEGAVQVPPDGRPIVMLADHPVTGGYPVIAVVDRADLEVIAQAPPGSSVGFVTAR
jgi:allophanate hydrolase subunit 2